MLSPAIRWVAAGGPIATGWAAWWLALEQPLAQLLLTTLGSLVGALPMKTADKSVWVCLSFCWFSLLPPPQLFHHLANIFLHACRSWGCIRHRADTAPPSACSGRSSEQLQPHVGALPRRKRVRNSVSCEGVSKRKNQQGAHARSVGRGHSREPDSNACFRGTAGLQYCCKQ